MTVPRNERSDFKPRTKLLGAHALPEMLKQLFWSNKTVSFERPCFNTRAALVYSDRNV